MLLWYILLQYIQFDRNSNDFYFQLIFKRYCSKLSWFYWRFNWISILDLKKKQKKNINRAMRWIGEVHMPGKKSVDLNSEKYGTPGLLTNQISWYKEINFYHCFVFDSCEYHYRGEHQNEWRWMAWPHHSYKYIKWTRSM